MCSEARTGGDPPAGAGPTYGEVATRVADRLARAGVPDPRDDAERLVRTAVGLDRGVARARRSDPFPVDRVHELERLVAGRARREPYQYLVGRQEFRGLELAVGPGVLVPRPETELLVDALLEADLPSGARVADLGTGSGCIAVALASARPDLRVVAVERSAAALAVARTNVRALAPRGRVGLVRADFGDAPFRSGCLDAVVSNPPYVAPADWERLEPEVRDHEPREALVADGARDDPFSAYRAVSALAWRALVSDGVLVVELGYDGERAVVDVLRAAGFGHVDVRLDFADIARVAVARRDGRAA